jgi:hypothetical protein
VSIGTGGTEAASFLFEPSRSILAKRNEAYNASGKFTKPKTDFSRNICSAKI